MILLEAHCIVDVVDRGLVALGRHLVLHLLVQLLEEVVVFDVLRVHERHVEPCPVDGVHLVLWVEVQAWSRGEDVVDEGLGEAVVVVVDQLLVGAVDVAADLVKE